MSKADFDRGVRHGINSDEFTDGVENMLSYMRVGNAGYWKGREKGREIRLARQAAKEAAREQRRRAGKKRESGSGYTGGGGGYDDEPQSIFVTLFYLVTLPIMAILLMFAVFCGIVAGLSLIVGILTGNPSAIFIGGIVVVVSLGIWYFYDNVYLKVPDRGPLSSEKIKPFYTETDTTDREIPETVSKNSGFGDVFVPFIALIGLGLFIYNVAVPNRNDGSSNEKPTVSAESQTVSSSTKPEAKKAVKRKATVNQAQKRERSKVEIPEASSGDDISDIPKPLEQPAPRLTRNLTFQVPNGIPPGAQVEAWIVENGGERRLALSGGYHSNGMVHVSLAEEIPENSVVNLKYVSVPHQNDVEEIARRRMMLHQQGFLAGKRLY